MKAANHDRSLALAFHRWAPASELAQVATPCPAWSSSDDPAACSDSAVESNLRWLRFAFGIEPG
jgi:hypothetical protein